MSSTNLPPSYPAIRFISEKGDLLAVLVALAPLLLSIWGVAEGWSWIWLPIAVAAGALLWVVVRSYVEVLRILSDTLMPR